MDDLVNKTGEEMPAPDEGVGLASETDAKVEEPNQPASADSEPSVEPQNLQPAGERPPLVMPDVQPKAEPVIAEALNGTEESGPIAPVSTNADGIVTTAEADSAKTLESAPPVDIKHLLAKVGDGSADNAMAVELEIAKLRGEAGASTAQ